MSRKLRRSPILLLILLLAGAAPALTADKADMLSGGRLTGTVAFVDADTGLLWLTARDGHVVKMATPTTLLKALSTGDRVEMAVVKEARPYTDGTERGESVSAQVQKVDTTLQFLRFKTATGEIIDLQPSAMLLDNLQAGESVEVAIHKQN